MLFCGGKEEKLAFGKPARMQLASIEKLTGSIVEREWEVVAATIGDIQVAASFVNNRGTLVSLTASGVCAALPPADLVASAKWTVFGLLSTVRELEMGGSEADSLDDGCSWGEAFEAGASLERLRVAIGGSEVDILD